MENLSTFIINLTQEMVGSEVADFANSVFHEMSKHITCATTVLHDAKTAASDIDKVLNGMQYSSKIGTHTNFDCSNVVILAACVTITPSFSRRSSLIQGSYIGLPTDVALQFTPSINLQVPLTTTLPPNNPNLQTHVLEKIRGLIDSASSPIIIVDGGTQFLFLFKHHIY
jgi:pyruvate decarboxylase